MNPSEFKVRNARVADAQAIHDLLTRYSDQELLLPRSENEILPQIPNFFVITDQQQIIGCVSLEIFSTELGEVRSLAVSPDYKNRQLGAKLLTAVEDYARDLGLTKMMALTYVEGFFHKFGYQTVEMTSLPEKVWRVCVKCPRFHHCDEIPVLKLL